MTENSLNTTYLYITISAAFGLWLTRCWWR